VPSGNLTITVTNKGRLGHTLRIRTRTDRNVLAFTTLQPGESKTRSFKLSRGTYTMYCVLANHEELGMHGTLVAG
jgi:plastocyanin